MIQNAQIAKAEKYLNSFVRHNNKIVTIKEWLNLLKCDGYLPCVETMRDTAKEEKETERLNRIYRSSDFVSGNPNWPATKKYLEDKAELEKGIFKTVYLMRSESTSYVITKTAYDYLMNENS
jgi:hypothetical protein